MTATEQIARYGVWLAAGFTVGLGTRYGSGCTSGHGISGSLQLAVSSWSFFIVMFVAGSITAFAIFGRAARN